jgi:hypothetical protein
VQANIDKNKMLPAYRPQRLDRGEATIAVVGYGPSLHRTWEELKDYRTIWTVSGAHDFLIERGIVPTYHTDVDWRSHKVLTKLSPAVEYRMGNTVDPEYMNQFRGYNLSVFQPFGPEAEKYLTLDSYYERVDMPGDVAMLVIKAAAAEGWKDIHVFGVDGSFDFGAKEQHAGPHKGPQGARLYVTDEEHNLYETSINFLRTCDVFGKMVDELPNDVGVTVASDGLLPAWLDMHAKRRNGNG